MRTVVVAVIVVVFLLFSSHKTQNCSVFRTLCLHLYILGDVQYFRNFLEPFSHLLFAACWRVVGFQRSLICVSLTAINHETKVVSIEIKSYKSTTSYTIVGVRCFYKFWSINQLIDSLIDCLIGWLIDWLILLSAY